MTAASPTFLGRPDTFFGICEAIGQDTGIPANLIRIALGAGVLFAPVLVIASYLVMGVAVVVSRLLFPVAKSVPVAAPAVVEAVEPEPMKLAA